MAECFNGLDDKYKTSVKTRNSSRSDDTLSNLIREYWLQDSELRPNATAAFQILDTYISQLQNEDDVSPMQHYNASQVKDTISAGEIRNSIDERESCIEGFATTELQDTEPQLYHTQMKLIPLWIDNMS